MKEKLPFIKKPLQQTALAISNDNLPPHSPEAERGALSCVLLAGDNGNQQEVETLLQQMQPGHFYEMRNKTLFCELVKMKMSEPAHAVNLLTVWDWLKQHKLIEQLDYEYLSVEVADSSPSYSNFGYYLPTLQQMFLKRRLLTLNERVKTLAHNPDVSVDDVHELFEDLTEKTSKYSEKRPALKIWRAKELLAFQPPTHLRLIGDNEVNMGYDGLTLISGPGSSGKSLVAGSAALAGARGSGLWQGRPVHRQFKTLILQAENGSVRLKDEIEAMAKHHPDIDIDGHVFFSEPPEGGLPFHIPEFRRSVRKAIGELAVQLVILDTWSQCSVEDSSKDVMDKLTEIRSCFPAGDKCPGLLIIAHTKKPRTEEVRKGRSLTYNVSGSVALPNTARCVYMLLPWSDELEEDRIYWACTKLNNGKMYSPSVWHRRFGTFFDHDPQTDPTTWGVEEPDEENRAIKPGELIKAFGTESVLTKSTLAKRLEKSLGVAYSTAMRAITPGRGGYLHKLIEQTKEGYVQLQENGE